MVEVCRHVLRWTWTKLSSALLKIDVTVAVMFIKKLYAVCLHQLPSSNQFLPLKYAGSWLKCNHLNTNLHAHAQASHEIWQHRDTHKRRRILILAHSGLWVWRLASSHHSAGMSGTQKHWIAPNHTDGEADRPTDMDVDVYNNTRIMTWVMLMIWRSASIPGRNCGSRDMDPCSLCVNDRGRYWRWELVSEKERLHLSRGLNHNETSHSADVHNAHVTAC